MGYFYGYNLSDQQVQILELIFKYRGMTVFQLGQVIYRGEEFTWGKQSHLYKKLRNMVSQGLIKKEMVSIGNTSYFRLTEDGMEVCKESYNIIPGHIGEGFRNDFGDFPFELSVLPDRQANHALKIVDMMLKIEELKREYLEYDFDVRDNRYSTRTYTEGQKGAHKTLKPDAEILLNGDSFFVEVDMGTERGRHLHSKFQRYYHFVLHQIKVGKPIPKAILFVSDQSDRRWYSVAATFLAELKEYATQLNLIFCSIDELKRVLPVQAERNSYPLRLQKIMKPYVEHKGYKGTDLHAVSKEKHGISFDKGLFSITQMTPQVLFTYSQMNGRETIGIARLLYLDQWFLEKQTEVRQSKDRHPAFEAFRHVKHRIPILYYVNEKPDVIRVDSSFPLYEVFIQFFGQVRFVSIGEKVQWESVDYTLREEHPLMLEAHMHKAVQ